MLVGAVPEGEDDGTADLVAKGAEVIRVPSLVRGLAPAGDARALREVLAILRRVRPDVVHTHTAKAGALGRVAARLARVPVVVHTFHGHHFDGGGLAACAARVLERRLADLTTRAICLSPRQRDDVVVRHRIFPADRVVVIPPVIDADGLRARASPEAVTAARARGSRPGETVLLWLGRHVAVKNPVFLVDAFATARLANPTLRLWLAGDGPLRPAVLARVAALGLRDHVSDLGPVADPAPVVGACDALVLASSSEGTPIAILEALALGRRVVATAVGGVPDLLATEPGCALVPAGDATAFASALAATRAASGDRPPEPVPSTTVARTAALYRELRDARPPRSG